MLPQVIQFFFFLQTHRQTSLVPESQICQRCAGTSCRFPVALVSRRSYSQSTQTHHNRHPLHSPGSAGSQLERREQVSGGGGGPYHPVTADTVADCCRCAGNENHVARRHNSTLSAEPITKLMGHVTISLAKRLFFFRIHFALERSRAGAVGEGSLSHSWGSSCRGTLGDRDITVSFCTSIRLHCSWHWDGMVHCRYSLDCLWRKQNRSDFYLGVDQMCINKSLMNASMDRLRLEVASLATKRGHNNSNTGKKNFT